MYLLDRAAVGNDLIFSKLWSSSFNSLEQWKVKRPSDIICNFISFKFESNKNIFDIVLFLPTPTFVTQISSKWMCLKCDSIWYLEIYVLKIFVWQPVYKFVYCIVVSFLICPSTLMCNIHISYLIAKYIPYVYPRHWNHSEEILSE